MSRPGLSSDREGDWITLNTLLDQIRSAVTPFATAAKHLDMEGYDQIPVAAIKTEVMEWRQDHDPLSRNALHTIESQFMRQVGEPARLELDSVTNLKNPQMRVASAADLGVFAYEADVVLVELDDEVDCGELLGYPIEDGWAPVLVCLAGPISEAKDRMEMVVVTLQGTADGDLAV